MVPIKMHHKEAKDLEQFPIQSAQILTACCKDNA